MQYWLAPLNVELPDHVGLKGELYPANRRPNFKMSWLRARETLALVKPETLTHLFSMKINMVNILLEEFWRLPHKDHKVKLKSECVN